MACADFWRCSMLNQVIISHIHCCRTRATGCHCYEFFNATLALLTLFFCQLTSIKEQGKTLHALQLLHRLSACSCPADLLHSCNSALSHTLVGWQYSVTLSRLPGCRYHQARRTGGCCYPWQLHCLSGCAEAWRPAGSCQCG